MHRPSCILLDRDGTLIYEREYLSDPAGVELLPGVVEALRIFRQFSCPLIVITNQAGIGRGKFTWTQLEAVNAKMAELLSAEGITLDAIYVCPHKPTDDCHCRKPRPGLILQAQRDWHFDLSACLMIGDKTIDAETGRNAGGTGILVRTGYGQEFAREEQARGTIVVDDLLAAARWLQAAVTN